MSFPVKMKPSISTNDIKSLAIELRRLADVKEEKLKFEIAKFKFRNPGFEYNYPSSTSECALLETNSYSRIMINLGLFNFR